jgi:hypothetical protein
MYLIKGDTMVAEIYSAKIHSSFIDSIDEEKGTGVITTVEVVPPMPRALGGLVCEAITKLFHDGGAEDNLPEEPSAIGFCDEGAQVSTQIRIQQKYEPDFSVSDAFEAHEAILQVVGKELSPSGKYAAMQG